MKDFTVSSEAEKHSSTSKNVSAIRQIRQLCMFNYHKYSTPSQHGELVFLSSYFHMTSLPMLCLKLNIFSLDCHVCFLQHNWIITNLRASTSSQRACKSLLCKWQTFIEKFLLSHCYNFMDIEWLTLFWRTFEYFPS